MRYFAEVELPVHVPIEEAAHWIAFGSLPEANYDFSGVDRPIEIRENIDEILDKGGHVLIYDLYLGETFLSRYFPSIDVKLYLSDYEKCGGKTPAQVEAQIDSWSDLRSRRDVEEQDAEFFKQLPSRDDEFQEVLLAAKRLRQMQRPIIHKLDTARAKVFLELASGRLKSKGLELPPIDSPELESDDFEFPTDFSDIPPDSWGMNSIDWDASNLNLWDRHYMGVIVETSEMLKIFPNPDITPASVSGKVYGATFALEDETDTTSASEGAARRRGAPQRTDNALEAAIQAHLKHQEERGLLATKQEARIAEITDFVRNRLGQELARSTAQRILQRWMTSRAQK